MACSMHSPGKFVAEIVKLRLARKAKTRADKDTTARANRLAFGRSKAKRRADEATAQRSDRLLDGARREH